MHHQYVVPICRTAIHSSSLLVCFLLAACAGSTPTDTRYYLLDNVAKFEEAIKIPSFKLGIGPIELSSYLKHEGIATHKENNVIVYSDSHLWAEPLERNINQVLLANINTLLVNQTVYPFPWKVSQRPDYQVIVSITRLGQFPNSQVTIKSRITIEGSDDQILFSGEKNHSIEAADDTYESNIVAQNQLLKEYSKMLVDAVVRAVE